MEKDRKFRALAIAAICIAVVGVSVAYAALSTQLSITGTGTVSYDNSWKIVFNTISGTGKSNAVTGNFPITGETTTISWSATFGAPQTYYTFATTLENLGTIPAKLSLAEGKDSFIGCSNGDESKDVCSNMTYTVTIDETDIDSFDDYIWAGKDGDKVAKKVVVVRVEFDKDAKLNAEKLTALNAGTATFTLSLPFAQATDTEVANAGSKLVATA